MSKLIPTSVHIQIEAFVKKQKQDTAWGNLFNFEAATSSPEALCPKRKTNKIKTHKTSFKLSKINHTHVLGERNPSISIKTKNHPTPTDLPRKEPAVPVPLPVSLFDDSFVVLSGTRSINS